MTRPITVLVCALGGEGGGVLAEWLFDAALRAGHSAQSTSIPGVAQRTGATTYYVEMHPEPDTALGGRQPVFSLNPVPGGIDLLVSSELLETLRQVGAGMVSADRTLVVSATTRALTVAEKMQPTDGRADSAALLATLQRHARAADLLDLGAMAAQAGTAISAVLLGAIAASGVLPLPRAVYEDTIRASGKGVAPSLRGFALAYEAVTQRRAQQAQVQAQAQAVAETTAASMTAAMAAGLVAAAAPAAAAGTAGPDAPDAPADAPDEPDLRVLARDRLRRYQDAAYVRLYDERLARVLAATASSPGDEADRSGIVQEMTRWLALWMAFDDIVHVAGLKLAASRQLRVQREVKAAPGEVLKVYDHFKPGVPEFAALLPERIAQRLRAWDRRRVAAGKDPWALPLKVGTHTVAGTLALRAVAALKGQRRRGSRFALEQALIERWLAAVERGTREDAALGLELARCGRLVKGYGSTNERGKENLLHIVDHLAGVSGVSAVSGVSGTSGVSAASAASGAAVDARPPMARAAAVRAAREAALADDAGTAFDRSLQAHGAPPRAPREQVVRWFKRRPDSARALLP